jgi:outer membrane immunogenic protein
MLALRYAAAIAATFAGIAAASAADVIRPVVTQPPPRVVPVAAAPEWSGVYLGVQGGWVHMRSQVEYTPNDTDNGWQPVDTAGFWGVHLGIDKQRAGSPLVVGLDTDWNWTRLRGTDVYCESGVCRPPGDYDGTVAIRWFGSTRLRLGWAHNKWLPFASVGVAYSHYDFIISDAFNPVLSQGSGDLFGWTAGAGVKVKIHPRVEFLAEYRYTDYGWDDLGGTLSPVDPAFNDVSPKRAKVITHAALFGLSVKFPP